MLAPRATNRFRKDLKKHAMKDLELLLEVTEAMRQILHEERLPAWLKPHRLSGEYADCWECHIRPDLLLVWSQDRREQVVTFVRLGSHDELFR